MDFLEAAEIAKRNPGSYFTRGESGLFVVHFKDGRVVTSPEELSAPPQTSQTQATPDSQKRLEKLEQLVTSLARKLEISNTEIGQLRYEVNSLKATVAKIPSSEWSRFEEEQRKIDEQRRIAERDRIMGLARCGELSYDQLYLVADNATSLGIADDELKFIHEEIVRKCEALDPGEARGPGDGFIIYSKTDGQ